MKELSSEYLEQHRQLYINQSGAQISEEVARAQANALIDLVELTYRSSEPAQATGVPHIEVQWQDVAGKDPSRDCGWLMGLWEFSDLVTLETVVDLAEEWARRDAAYLQLTVRRSGKRRLVIAFTRELESSPGAHHRYVDDTLFEVRRRFGARFLGYDVGSPVLLVHQRAPGAQRLSEEHEPVPGQTSFWS